jgi:hypothetical protein
MRSKPADFAKGAFQMTHPTPMDEREIDGKIAELLFNWKFHLLNGKRYLQDITSTKTLAKGDEPLWVDWYGMVPRYSTDMAAAFQVVEAMRGLGYVTEISACVGYYGVRVVEDKTSIVKATRIIKTVADLPRAICECALIAVEVKG